jgi:alkanesulfonate monooxygenase SsuD/methylene tetrahydromethanopterin reductase-like flavin-dependent oxidoreductase (luciferase family)
MIGVNIQSMDARQAIDQVIAAEQAGIPVAWAISGRGPDLMPIWSAAAARTDRIVLGTAIIRTWTRHPVGFAQEALAFEQLFPGRLRLGIGPTGRAAVEQMFGGRYDKPLTHLREYAVTIRSLLHEGKVDFAGEFVTTRAELPAAPGTPVLISAAGPKAWELGGEISDGAIAWVAPKRYLVETALPAIRRGAGKAGRKMPPVVAHVPVAITPDRAAAEALARDQLGAYGGSPHFARTWAAAGHDPAAGLTPALLADLLVSGDEDQVVAGLRGWVAAGFEILAHPLIDPNHPAGSLERCFAAIGRAANE